MDDLISRQAAIYALLEKGQKSRRYKVGEIWELNFDEIREALATVPSADPKKGKWITEEKDCIYGKKIRLKCSECGDTFDVSEMAYPYERFCRYCGADMRGNYGKAS